MVQTRPRQEKALATVLDASGIEFYLPLVQRVKYYAHRRRRVEVPLFGPYLFLWGFVEQTYFAMSTKRVAQVIRVADQCRLAHELRQVQDVLARGGRLDPHPGLTRGRRVRVSAGPFKGVEGLVEENARRDRLILHVHSLARGASLEIEADLLEPVDDS